MPQKPAATMADAIAAYHSYVSGQLDELRNHLGTLRAAVANADTPGAQGAWLQAQQCWQRVGAAYGSFGELGDAIAPGSRGLQGGSADPEFKGLRRIEYGLWHGQGAPQLLPAIDQLAKDLQALAAKLPGLSTDPADMPLRLHEILEDSQRDHLSGNGDQGSGMAIALTRADVEATQEVLDLLRTLLQGLKAGFPALLDQQLAALLKVIDQTRTGGTWTPYRSLSLLQRQRINGALGRVLESLALVPALFSTD
ncbi:MULTISPECIES: EfeM/EfeO family lipoprotein [Arthrobacter]|uniref:EfeM/EfeO family lipoprotein n=2 Tax=Arthrobacter TaxID=1663 RepID=A0ABU9KFN9_9MICC|nr:EfeM/EfeO family lipoprotein [Arthrobacter sp. YJM1]MDP5225701.1 EfeM/EfeO family lipoprotein [Arthrobacter sp. YJM1]